MKKILFFIIAILLLRQQFNVVVFASQKNTYNDTPTLLVEYTQNIFSPKKTNKPTSENHQKIIQEKYNSNNSDQSTYFVKIEEQILPININNFSERMTVLRYSSAPYHSTVENIYICKNNPDLKEYIFCHLTTTLNKKSSLKREDKIIINKTALQKTLEALNEKSKRLPKNAKLGIDANTEKVTVTEKEKIGYTIDIKKIIDNPEKYFSPKNGEKIFSLPVKKILPTLTSTNYRELGIKEKIGHGESNFRRSPKNRIHNIHNASSKFAGILIPPNETFSFIDTLGEVNRETGYKEELVIKDHKTIPEFGGGICQVSTTLFRAAVNSGLKIIERRNHAYPVQYYSPQGTDATIYIPKPDLKFINNTPGFILIQPNIKGTVLSFDIFGTNDGRKVETEGPILLKTTPEGDRKYVWWQIIKDAKGNILEKNGFWSFYQNEAKFHENNSLLTSKPRNWSNREWKKYKREHGF